MRKLISDIRAGANEARLAEGDSRDLESWHKAYELWTPVFELCHKFDQDFYLNPNVEWAKRKEQRREKGQIRRNRIEGFGIGVITSVVGGLILLFLIWLFSS